MSQRTLSYLTSHMLYILVAAFANSDSIRDAVSNTTWDLSSDVYANNTTTKGTMEKIHRSLSFCFVSI